MSIEIMKWHKKQLYRKGMGEITRQRKMEQKKRRERNMKPITGRQGGHSNTYTDTQENAASLPQVHTATLTSVTTRKVSGPW